MPHNPALCGRVSRAPYRTVRTAGRSDRLMRERARPPIANVNAAIGHTRVTLRFCIAVALLPEADLLVVRAAVRAARCFCARLWVPKMGDGHPAT